MEKKSLLTLIVYLTLAPTTSTLFGLQCRSCFAEMEVVAKVGRSLISQRIKRNEGFAGRLSVDCGLPEAVKKLVQGEEDSAVAKIVLLEGRIKRQQTSRLAKKASHKAFVKVRRRRGGRAGRLRMREREREEEILTLLCHA